MLNCNEFARDVRSYVQFMYIVRTPYTRFYIPPTNCELLLVCQLCTTRHIIRCDRLCIAFTVTRLRLVSIGPLDAHTNCNTQSCNLRTLWHDSRCIPYVILILNFADWRTMEHCCAYTSVQYTSVYKLINLHRQEVQLFFLCNSYICCSSECFSKHSPYIRR